MQGDFKVPHAFPFIHKLSLLTIIIIGWISAVMILALMAGQSYSTFRNLAGEGMDVKVSASFTDLHVLKFLSGVTTRVDFILYCSGSKSKNQCGRTDG